MASVELEGITKIFPKGVVAVQDLDLTINDGELLVLFGPSGCGKTTCLRLIAGLEEPTRGELRMAGRAVTRWAPRDRDVALIFQHGALYPHLTVYGNMAAGLEFRWGSGRFSRVWRWWFQSAKAAAMAAQRRGIRQRVWETAELLGIERLLDRTPRQLSGGERQRVALGRALVRQPAVFLLDEPLSHLDAGLRFDLRRELRQLQRRLAATMVYVTHDQWEAMALGDRIAVMERGRIRQVGAPRTVYDEPANRFVASCLGHPPMNLLRGSLSVGESRWRFCGGGVCVSGDGGASAPAGAVELGVRPEHVRLAPAGAGRSSDPAVCGRGVVVDVEALGDRDLVYVELATAGGAAGGPRVVCRRRSGCAAELGGVVDVSMERVHLFDGVSGASVRRAARPRAVG